jgi:hypothetical protein
VSSTDRRHYLSAQLCCRACQSFALHCPDCGRRHLWDWRKDPETAAILLQGGLQGLTAISCHCGADLLVSVSPGTRLSPERCRLERSYQQTPARGFGGRRGEQSRKPAPPPPAPLRTPCPADADRRRLADWAAAGVGGGGVSGGAIAAAYRRLFELEPPRDPMGRSFRVYTRRELALCMAAAGFGAEGQGVQL